MSVFDGVGKAVFAVVNAIMGDTAIWTPSTGPDEVSEKVLFNDPESIKTLGDVDKAEYSPFKYWFEYYSGQFSGLKDSVDSGNVETIQIQGLTLDVFKIDTKFDGKNYIAYCVIHE